MATDRVGLRDLPERFGDWKIVHQRFGRWEKNGVFERIYKMLASDHDNEYMMIDATIVRAHPPISRISHCLSLSGRTAKLHERRKARQGHSSLINRWIPKAAGRNDPSFYE